MAAQPEPPLDVTVDLSKITVADLDPLLTEEIAAWRERFHWDFRPSADLLRRFVQIQSLQGRALFAGERLIGYAYYVAEGRKGLLGNYFMAADAFTPEREFGLLEAVISEMERVAGVKRIESQLMMLRNTGGPFPFSKQLFKQERQFMQAEVEAVRALPVLPVTYNVRTTPFEDRFGEELSPLLTASYRGHVDAEINDQYRTIPGARMFLSNIIRFPGCGKFAPEASRLALDPATGRVCGMCLASRISEDAGHITQLCILPALRGSRIGYELMRHTANRLVDTGSKFVSLTVTSSNVDAVNLYSRSGFRTVAMFPALVWDNL